jgi:hypothetical protein
MPGSADVVKAAWDAYIAGDLDGVVARMEPSVAIDLTNFEGWPEDSVYHGHAGFLRWITEWLAGFERYEAGVEEPVEASPGCVLTFSWQRGYGAGSHVPVEMELAQVTTVRGRLIARMEIWSDREAARAAAFRR